MVAAVEDVRVTAVVGGGEAEREALEVEIVATEQDPVRPRRPTPKIRKFKLNLGTSWATEWLC